MVLSAGLKVLLEQAAQRSPQQSDREPAASRTHGQDARMIGRTLISGFLHDEHPVGRNVVEDLFPATGPANVSFSIFVAVPSPK